jgi:hypothetical protein
MNTIYYISNLIKVFKERVWKIKALNLHLRLRIYVAFAGVSEDSTELVYTLDNFIFSWKKWLITGDRTSF